MSINEKERKAEAASRSKEGEGVFHPVDRRQWAERKPALYTVERAVPYYDQVYHSIKDMIIKGVFQPGDRLYEAKIAREFNISRSPVREAVRALEKEGLLVIGEKSKITVYKPSVKDVEDIYQCRMALESLAARLAAELATSDQVSLLERTLVETEKLVGRNDEKSTDEMLALNSRFHTLITEFSQNRRLQKQLSELRTLIYYYMHLNIQGDNRKKTIFQDHREIFIHIRKGDGRGASEAMEQHIARDLDHLKRLLVK